MPDTTRRSRMSDVAAATGPRLLRVARKVTVALVGSLVVLVGVALLVLPGPGWLVIVSGLGLLAREFPWAARLLARGRRVARALWARVPGRRRSARPPGGAHRAGGPPPAELTSSSASR